jgi:hypothetical protein
LDKVKGAAISVKIRVYSGCFHREHSPYAYRIIDKQLLTCSSKDENFSFQEHESGPEILVYVALGTVGITLAKSIIDLITAIIKARSEGIKLGDSPDAPLELIVRRFDNKGKIKEETVLRFGSQDQVKKEFIEESLKKKISEILSEPKKRNKHAA